MSFDRDDFLNKNKESRGDITPGTYLCELEASGIAQAKSSGKLQLSEYWKVDDDDLRHAGATISSYTKLYDDDGKSNRYFHDRLKYLQLQIDPEQITTDESKNIEYLDKLVKTRVGCKARIKVAENKKDPRFPYKNILEIVEGGDGQASADTFKYGANAPSEVSLLEDGNVVNVTLPDGERAAVVKAVVDNGKQVMVQFLSDNTSTVVPAKDCYLLCKTVEEWNAKKPVSDVQPEKIEEIQEVDLEDVRKAGGIVTGVWNNTTIRGKIHALDEKNGIVKIAYNGSAYPCPVDTIEIAT
jgi:hypothetical protein